MPGLQLPSRITEAADPDEADTVYDSCALFLRERTRDSKAFPLVFAENISYGMCRNLWGMKPAGIALSAIGVIASVLALILQTTESQIPPFPLVATVTNALMLVFWLLRISSDWVRMPAFAYAERLLATCDSLPMPVSKPSASPSVPTE